MKNKINRKTKYQFAILRPGGNDTMLIKGVIKNPAQKKFINDQMMNLFPNIEQVGFYDFDLKTTTATLEMAGGEFCGNALRSLAYLLLEGKDGDLEVNVSGTTKKLIAGVENNQAYAQIPILNDLNSVKILKGNTIVSLEGITHLITKKYPGLNPIQLKRLGKQLLSEAGLLKSVPAAGVMFTTQTDTELKIDPIVWVRNIKTLFYETACASGTAAVGLYKAKQSALYRTEIKIKQPSGYYISVSVARNQQSFINAQIRGTVKIICQENIELEAINL